jgi:hypothetical protein
MTTQTANPLRTKIAQGFDAALRTGGVTPKSVTFEGSRVAILLATEKDLAAARALLTAAGSQEMDDFDLTETGRGHLLLVGV